MIKRIVILLGVSLALFQIVLSQSIGGGGGVGGGDSPFADNVLTDTTNFNNLLSSSDSDVQAALDTIDNNAGGGTAAFELDSNNDLMPVTGVFTTVHFEVDGNDDLMPIS